MSGLLSGQVGGGSSGSLDSVSVKAAPYNAVGNGSADDTAAVAAAITAALAAGLPVYFPAGTYLITTQGGSPARCVTITGGTSGLRVIGDNATIKFDSSVAHAFYLGTGCNKITFSGLKFQGFTGTGADDFNVNAFAAVFTQSNAIDVTIDACRFDHVMPAFFTSDDVSARLQFTRNLSTDQPNALSPPGYSLITDNTFHDTAVVGTRSHAIYIFGRAEHVIVSRNSFKNQGDSCIQIRANDARYLQKRCWHITDNYFEKCNFYGLFLSTLTSQINIGTCIIANNIFKNVVSPMQLIGMRDTLVTTNVLEWDYQYAGLAGNGIILGSATSVETSIANGVHIVNNRLINRHPFYGAVTFSTLPTAGDTITVGSVTYTWRAAPTLSGEVAIGGTVDVCALNLAQEIQGASRTVRNQVIRDSSDVWYSQNSTEGKLWIASNATFALSKTGAATSVVAVFNNSVAMAPAIDVSNAILPVIEGNSIEGNSTTSAQMTVQGCVDPIIRNNTVTMQGGSGIIGKSNSRPIYQGNRATWSRAIAAAGAVPNAIVTSYDAFAVMRDNGLVQDQDGTLPWLMGASGTVPAGDGRARTYLYYGNEVATANPAMATFHWEDGDMCQLFDGSTAFNFKFKRSGPNGTTEFNSYASLMALINTQTGGAYTATNPALTYFGSDPLAYGYIEIKRAAIGTAGNACTLDTSTNLTTGLVPKHRTCGVTLEKWYANATNSVFRGGAATPTKTVVFTPLASTNTPLLVQGVDEASESLVPRCYAADTVPGICYVITHNAVITGSEKFLWKVA